MQVETCEDLEERVEVDTTDIVGGRRYTLQGMESAGLRGSPCPIQIFLRESHLNVFDVLNGNALIRGPPDTGKSTASWFWLLRTVALQKECAVWYHFSRIQPDTCLLIRPTTNDKNDNTVSILPTCDDNPFKFVGNTYAGRVKHCVVDGLLQENLPKIKESWYVFGKSVRVKQMKSCHMIFVTSQQVVIPGEELAATETTKYEFLSWSLEDVLAFTNDMSDNEKHEFSHDFEGLLTKNFSLANAIEKFEDIIKAKYWIFGGSACWMFGLTSERAWSDLLDFLLLSMMLRSCKMA
jgi:hypothetical protein